MTRDAHRPQPAGFRVLATDLDGTLLPLEGNAQNQADLATLMNELRAHGRKLVFVTGRHLESVQQAIVDHGLDLPDALIADVGTSVYKQEQGVLQPVTAYQDALDALVEALPLEQLRVELSDDADLRLQETAKQGRFKLSYYVDGDRLDAVVARVQARLDATKAPYSIVRSVDPFNGDGLVDLLPAGVSKAYALEWWARAEGLTPDDLIFAGDSGNDLAALTAGYRAIVVGNAPPDLARRVEEAHRNAGRRERAYLAVASATSGVLEGCRWFGGN